MRRNAGGPRHPQAMLTEIYIDALLVDEELADLVWEAWDSGTIDDSRAWWLWLHIAVDDVADR